jgi:hypothetical protein
MQPLRLLLLTKSLLINNAKITKSTKYVLAIINPNSSANKGTFFLKEKLMSTTLNKATADHKNAFYKHQNQDTIKSKI